MTIILTIDMCISSMAVLVSGNFLFDVVSSCSTLNSICCCCSCVTFIMPVSLLPAVAHFLQYHANCGFSECSERNSYTSSLTSSHSVWCQNPQASHVIPAWVFITSLLQSTQRLFGVFCLFKIDCLSLACFSISAFSGFDNLFPLVVGISKTKSNAFWRNGPQRPVTWTKTPVTQQLLSNVTLNPRNLEWKARETRESQWWSKLSTASLLNVEAIKLCRFFI